MIKDYSLRRDTLDYILTDSTPVETSELFTYNYMYEYLHAKRSEVDKILKEIGKKEKNIFRDTVPFLTGWNTMPLDFRIQKNDGSLRKMCVPQPLSVVNMYYFISLYQKDILNILSKPSFSIRYQKRNSDLFYIKKSKKLIDYQYKRDRSSKTAIEQSGRYFDIGPFKYILDFELSEDWRITNLKYKYFCKLDYKRCFDSVYTHSYKWIVAKNIVDSKAFKNSSLYAVIDRMLQNINGSFSNGVPVGPEFSRMIVEVLLQAIDDAVLNSLLNEGIKKDIDYTIMRYVDDIYIFCNDLKVQDRILERIDFEASKYMLEINKLKTEKHETPYLKSKWLKDVEDYSVKLRKVFRYNAEVREAGEDFQIKCQSKEAEKLKEEFENLIAEHRGSSQTILNYVFAVIYNAVSQKEKKYKIFKNPEHRSLSYVLDLLFFIYSQAVTFNNTQRLISILYYFDNECELKASSLIKTKVFKYEAFIIRAYYSEYINLLVAFTELKVSFNSVNEEHILNEIKKADDPIALATYLYYSKYDDSLFVDTKANIDEILVKKHSEIIKKGSEFMYREAWYMLIFNKCPYIAPHVQKEYDLLMKSIKGRQSIKTSDQTMKLILKFLLDADEKHSFIAWNSSGARMLEQITYRTAQRTIFRNRSSRLSSSF